MFCMEEEFEVMCVGVSGCVGGSGCDGDFGVFEFEVFIGLRW